MSPKVRFLPVLISAFLIGLALNVSATPSISTSASATTNGETYNFTLNGTTDWVQFGVSGSTTAFNLSNEKSGGSVGGLDTVGAVSISHDSYGGRTQDTSPLLDNYTNGTSPTSSGASVNGSIAGNWNIQTNYGSSPPTGATLTFTIDFNEAIRSGNIYVVGNSYAVPETLFTAALSNGNTTTTTEGYSSSNQNDIFDIDLSNITAGSSLTLSWELESAIGSGNASYANVSLNGVALDLTEAPEPSTYAMMLGGVALLGLLVRRRNALPS